MHLNIRPMTLEDVDKVNELEKKIFTNPWSRNSIKQNVIYTHVCHSYVAETEAEIAGYTIGWIVEDELHIANLAVEPELRRKKIAESLMRTVLEEGEKAGCTYAYLEVRESNEAAIKLYEKLGFIKNGMRKNYYPDNNENALIMFKFFRKE